MSTWMINIEKAVKAWASAGALRHSPEIASIVAAVEAAWLEGVPTADALGYARRRIAHYSLDDANRSA